MAARSTVRAQFDIDTERNDMFPAGLDTYSRVLVWHLVKRNDRPVPERPAGRA